MNGFWIEQKASIVNGEAIQSAIRNPTSEISFVIPIVAGIGNALMAVPTVRQIRRNLPNAKITILARISAMGEPFRRLREVNEVVITGKGFKGCPSNSASETDSIGPYCISADNVTGNVVRGKSAYLCLFLQHTRGWPR